MSDLKQIMPDKTASIMSRPIRIGTRNSDLARVQTKMFSTKFAQHYNHLKLDIVPITTSGDKDRSRPIEQLGTGVFVKELEDALLNNEIDVVVHSLKDLLTDIPPGLTLACIFDRCDPRDALLSKSGKNFAELPSGSRVATSSRRRTAQAMAIRDDLKFVDIRGNVPTRIEKLYNSECDAIVLAAAGLSRLELHSKIIEYFDPEVCTPAAGQGALALECREEDEELLTLLKAIEISSARAEITSERALLRHLGGGGCSLPIGAFAESKKDSIKLIGCVCSIDGTSIIRGSAEGSINDPEKLGEVLAAQLMKNGAEPILCSLRRQAPAAISPP